MIKADLCRRAPSSGSARSIQFAPMSPLRSQALQAKGLNKPSTNGKRSKGTNGGGPPKH